MLLACRKFEPIKTTHTKTEYYLKKKKIIEIIR